MCNIISAFKACFATSHILLLTLVAVLTIFKLGFSLFNVHIRKNRCIYSGNIGGAMLRVSLFLSLFLTFFTCVISIVKVLGPYYAPSITKAKKTHTKKPIDCLWHFREVEGKTCYCLSTKHSKCIF